MKGNAEEKGMSLDDSQGMPRTCESLSMSDMQYENLASSGDQVEVWERSMIGKAASSSNSSGQPSGMVAS